MFVDHRAVAFELLIECNAVVRQPQQLGQPALSVLDRLGPNVLAVHLEQIERTQHRAGVSAMPADEIEHRQAVVVANDCLTVDDAGFDGQLLDRGGREREAVTEVIPLRVSRRTLRPPRCARIRKPSCLIA